MKRTRWLVAALLTLSMTAYAQSYFTVKKVINDAGYRCDRITNVRRGARIDNGDVLLIFDCTDGSSHVVRIALDDSVTYFGPCSSFAITAVVRCD